jgi:hypothetical protein
MDELLRRLAEIPERWHSKSVSPELLRCTFVSRSAPAESPVPETTLTPVRLEYSIARSRALGPRACKIGVEPEWFVALGWEPILFFDATAHFRAPEGGPEDNVLLVPVPNHASLLDLAYEKAADGVAWEGAAWRWPARFKPGRVNRIWEESQFRLWDGTDETGRPIGGSATMEAGWRDTSTLSEFEAGYPGVWHARITWQPQPVFIESLGGKPTGTGEVTFGREWRSE